MSDPDSSRLKNLKNDTAPVNSSHGLFYNLYKQFTNNLLHFFSRKIKTREQLSKILKISAQSEILSSEALNMIEGVLCVSDMQVRDIMIPRSQMVVLEIDCDIEESLPKMISCGHSRFPVIGENRDEVLGTILAKDLLPFVLNKANKININELLRPAMIVPESKRLNILLKEFRASRHHMAIVADEYGGISGLVTIEDVLEQIVGNIEDEFDIQESENIIKLDNDFYTVQALTPIIEFNEYFATDFSDEEFDTIGGVVLNSFGYLPVKNETIIIKNFKIRILNADKRRIRLLKICKIKDNKQVDVN